MTVEPESPRALEKPRTRFRYWIALGVALLLASAVVAYGVVSERQRRAAQQQQEAARARAQRVAPAAFVALAPLPVVEPIVDRPGKDAEGYPLSHVDRSALRSLLGRGKYRELSQYIEKFQRDFEADFHSEYFVSDSADAFESAERELGAKLDAWVTATPDSFAPYLARGAHGLALGHAGRGYDDTRDTAKDDFKAMNAAFAPAFADLEKALALNPRVIAALRNQMRIAFVGSAHRAEFRKLAARAFSLCPSCFQVRVTYQVGLEPRWGGSHAEMSSAALAAPPALNPRFKLLPGYVDIDLARGEREGKQPAVALKYVERACELGENADFLLERARVLQALGNSTGALQALTRALELRPSRPDLLLARARLHAEPGSSRDWQLAYTDLVAALRLGPTDPEVRALLPSVAAGLTLLGWQAHERGDAREALRFLDEAVELAPSRDLAQRRTAALTSGFRGTEQEIAELERNAKAARHDFYAHQRLDYALSTRRAWPRIAQMWNEYIAQNPQDGRAFLERAGTLNQQGKSAAARADAARACELGVSAGCAIAARR